MGRKAYEITGLTMPPKAAKPGDDRTPKPSDRTPKPNVLDSNQYGTAPLLHRADIPAGTIVLPPGAIPSAAFQTRVTGPNVPDNCWAPTPLSAYNGEPDLLRFLGISLDKAKMMLSDGLAKAQAEKDKALSGSGAEIPRIRVKRKTGDIEEPADPAPAKKSKGPSANDDWSVAGPSTPILRHTGSMPLYSHKEAAGKFEFTYEDKPVPPHEFAGYGLYPFDPNGRVVPHDLVLDSGVVVPPGCALLASGEIRPLDKIFKGDEMVMANNVKPFGDQQ